MKIICISCGYSLALDDAYGDFEGLIKCYVCGSLLEIKMSGGRLESLTLPALSCTSQPKSEHTGNSPCN